MRVAVGLGNPGARYASTRHNVGFKVVDVLARAQSAEWTETPAYLYSQVRIETETLILVKPTTFMNRSGIAFQDFQRRHELDLMEMLVLVDDVHLEFGRIRFRRGGSDGGHNGLKSIIESIGSVSFPRMRLGIGSPADEVDRVEYVLAEFGTKELDAVEKLARKASEGVQCWAAEGIDEAMNRFNAF